MQVVELEQFAFQLLNQLYDDYNLHIDDFTKWSNKISQENNAEEMEKIIKMLQTNLLLAMKSTVEIF